MTDQEYLESVLLEQALGADSPELRALRTHREDVEDLLRESFAEASPAIRYGGSYAKGTMNRDSYDLDLACYFERDDSDAGDTLQQIYDNVERALATKYRIERKSSAVRLHDCEVGTDFHIDVVPGRFVDEEADDVFLYQSSGEKGRLKTNLNVHIAHVKESGLIPTVRLLKLWAVRYHLGVKTFVLELLAVDLLSGKKQASLADQLSYVFEQLRDHSDGLSVEDPANPTGNDLSELLSATVRFTLAASSRQTLEHVRVSGWESVFGETQQSAKAKKIAALEQLAATATVRPQPHCRIRPPSGSA
jgi:hypothetical protein